MKKPSIRFMCVTKNCHSSTRMWRNKESRCIFAHFTLNFHYNYSGKHQKDEEPCFPYASLRWTEIKYKIKSTKTATERKGEFGELLWNQPNVIEISFCRLSKFDLLFPTLQALSVGQPFWRILWNLPFFARSNRTLRDFQLPLGLYFKSASRGGLSLLREAQNLRAEEAIWPLLRARVPPKPWVLKAVIIAPNKNLSIVSFE